MKAGVCDSVEVDGFELLAWRKPCFRRTFLWQIHKEDGREEAGDTWLCPSTVELSLNTRETS